jgi:23S rRNA pseudouridine1911/1915/1917 synthase
MRKNTRSKNAGANLQNTPTFKSATLMKYDLKLSTIIDARSEGKSLFEAISDRFSYQSPEFWLKRIEEGLITINSQRAKPDQLLCSGDLLDFMVPDFEEPDINTDYQTVWRNDFLLLINKPAGLPVHSTRRFYYQTLVGEIRRREGFTDINPLQRLDRETSGLMFVSQTSAVPKKFHKNFKNYLKGKFYLAIVRGRFSHDELSMTQPLKEASVPPVRYKMIAAPDGKTTRTDFYCIDRNDDFSLVLARLETGRKHQIRAHLEILGFPLIGEKLYYKNALYFLKRCNDELQAEDMAQLGAQNHLLHSYAVKTAFPDEPPSYHYADKFSVEFSQKLDCFKDWQEKARKIITACD